MLRKLRKRKKSLGKKLTAAVIIMVLLLSGMAIAIGDNIFKDELVEKYKRSAGELTRTVAELIDGDKVEEYIAARAENPAFVPDDEYYHYVSGMMQTMLKNNKLTYLYAVTPPTADRKQYTLFDTPVEGVEVFPFFHEDDCSPDWERGGWMYELMAQGKEVPTVVEYLSPEVAGDGVVPGMYVEGTAPIYNSARKAVGYVICYYSTADIYTENIQYLFVLSSATLSVSVISIFLFLLLVRKIVINPLENISAAANEWTYDDDELGADGVAAAALSIAQIDIKSGDELQTLAEALKSMALRIEEYENKKKIREADERIKAIFDSTPMACVLLDSNRRPRICNAEALRLFGVSSEEEYLEHFSGFMPEFQPDGKRSADKHASLISKAFESGYLRRELTHTTQSGEPLPTEVTLVRLEWKGAYALATYIRDLREEKAHEQKARVAEDHRRELQVQALAAQAASEAKSSFLASMSHEIRTPMNAIIGMSDLMRMDNMDKTQQGYFSDIKKMAYSLLQIINDILDFSKIEAGKMDIIPADYDVFLLFDNICSLTSFTMADKPLEFRRSIDESLPRVLFGDEVRIRQVIMNLINNAVKYTQEGFFELHIEREARHGADYLSVRVKDSGVGIPRKDFHKLFGAFEQADNKKNHYIPGTGLGLSITKRLVEMMGGSIKFASKYGEGTTFLVRLPLAEGNASRVTRADALKRVWVSPLAKVLVVDDNSINLTVALGFLARHNIQAETALDGLTAIEMAREKEYDLVFMDHMMPGIDGIETVRRIRALDGEYYRKLPIVALSANAVSGAREAFIEGGMNDFISKPIRGAELNETLIRWLPEELLLDDAPDSPEDENNDESEFDELLAQLAEIEDLNADEGLSHTAEDKAVYVSILSQFCKDLDKDISAVLGFKAEGNWHDYAIRVHAMKGVFANIGNHALFERALGLEKAARAGEIQKCLEETGDFCGEMENFRARLLRTSLMDMGKERAPRAEISGEALAEKLKRMSEFCLDCDTESANIAAAELRAVTFGETADALLDKICEAAESFDYDEAMARCEELTACLKS
ncbi:hypothetical protein FACS1894216_09010 [Synergistales bacterium]|nr:hypothetical protein FACS1894216_09010 [Synergistales bacterium]